MGRSTSAPKPVTSEDTLASLLAHARAISAGADSWISRKLRAEFVQRVRAGEDPLGESYLTGRSAGERRTIGATFTPSRIVRAMVKWASNEAQAMGRPARIVDPGAGSGRFAIAAARTFPAANVVAIETDPEVLALLEANLKASGLTTRVQVIGADFRSIQLPAIAGPTLFIGNPPYVRHHQIQPKWKDWYANVCARHGIKASRLAGLHLHFFAQIAEVGREGDYGCLITAAEWLDVGYGSALRSLLSNGLGGTEIHVLEPEVEAFPGTMSTSAITTFRVGRRGAKLRMRRVGTAAGLDRLCGGRSVDWAEAVHSRKWTLLVRDGPAKPAGMVELGEFCRVHRGQVTGSNRVWIVGLHTPTLPTEFLKPTVTRARELIGAEPSLDQTDHLARVIDLPCSLEALELETRKAIDRFIAWAKAAGVHEGYIARHRSPWWAVRLREPAPIVCTYMARRCPAFVVNRAGARLLNIAHGIYPREPLSEAALLRLTAALRATVTREHGRTYSGGLTKFEPSEIERLTIPAELI